MREMTVEQQMLFEEMLLRFQKWLERQEKTDVHSTHLSQETTSQHALHLHPLQGRETFKQAGIDRSADSYTELDGALDTSLIAIQSPRHSYQSAD